MKKGFTLLELLIVIAILAILAAAAVVVLNPAELLRRARDSERITDLANIRNSINLYLTTVSSPELDQGGTSRCTDEAAATLFTHIALTSTSTISSTAPVMNASTSRVTDGTGWIPINFNNTAGGSPLSALPIDPVDTIAGCSGDDGCSYYYMCNNGSSTYEIGANMESAVYANGGNDDIEGTDGGNASLWYEVGNDSGLDL